MNGTITTIADLIDALGGDTTVAGEFGISQPAVAAWKARGEIPGGWHLRIWAWAKRERLKVDPCVFGLTRKEADDLFGSDRPKKRAAYQPAA